MPFYHFTAIEHLPKILTDQKLTLTESNVSVDEPHYGPDVVWLTTDRTPERGHGLSAGGLCVLTPEQARAVGRPAGSRVRFYDKMAVRITIDLPLNEVRLWRRWAPRHGCSADTMNALALSGGSDSWFVCEQEIPAESWAAVETIRPVSHRADLMQAIVKSGITVGVRAGWMDRRAVEQQLQLARVRAVMTAS